MMKSSYIHARQLYIYQMRQPEVVNGMMRQYNDLKKTEKMTNNHIHSIGQK